MKVSRLHPSDALLLLDSPSQSSNVFSVFLSASLLTSETPFQITSTSPLSALLLHILSKYPTFSVGNKAPHLLLLQSPFK